MLRHFKLVVERFGVQQGTHLMRKFACCYAQGRRGARMFRTKVAHVESPEAFYEAVETAFPTDDEPPKQESNAVEPGVSS